MGYYAHIRRHPDTPMYEASFEEDGDFKNYENTEHKHFGGHRTKHWAVEVDQYFQGLYKHFLLILSRWQLTHVNFREWATAFPYYDFMHNKKDIADTLQHIKDWYHDYTHLADFARHHYNFDPDIYPQVWGKQQKRVWHQINPN